MTMCVRMCDDVSYMVGVNGFVCMCGCGCMAMYVSMYLCVNVCVRPVHVTVGMRGAAWISMVKGV